MTDKAARDALAHLMADYSAATPLGTFKWSGMADAIIAAGWNPPAHTYTYRSVTQGHIVTWTRDDDGIWHADDGRDGTAADEDIRQARDGIMQ